MRHLDADFLAIAPLWYIAFLMSTVCHEAAHALVAKWGGDDTAYAGGQVSLDPIPHIKREPFGLVVVPIITLISSGAMFGWGSAPFNPYWQVQFPRRAALMALAGPLANFTLAMITAIIIHLGLRSGVFVLPGSLSTGMQLIAAPNNSFLDGMATFLSIMFILNVILGVFNLLPVPPLDGYSVIGLLLPEDLHLKMIEIARGPEFSLIGILVVWKIFPLLASPVLGVALRLLYAPLAL